MTFAAAVALSGCFPTGGTSTPSPVASESTTATAEATPTPDPTVAAPVPTTLVISAANITVLDETSAVIITIPYTTAGFEAADQLSAALGTVPSSSSNGGGNCQRAGTSYDFGGFKLEGAGTITMAPPAVFSVNATGSATATGVLIKGPANVTVGTPLADVLAAIPGATATDMGFGNSFLDMELTADSPTTGFDQTGVLGVVNGGALTQISAPVYIFGDC
jgi:hypothetical protein